MRRLLILGAVLLVALVNVAAIGTSQSNAIAIASAIGLVLPFVYKVIPQAGYYMVAITVALSVVGAIVAEVLSGDLNLANLQSADPTHLYIAAMSVYGLSQFMFSTLKQSPKTLKAVV